MRRKCQAIALSAALTLGATLLTGVAAAHAQTATLTSAAPASAKETIRIGSGRTESGEGWFANDSISIYIDVDTTSAHFAGAPVYTSSIGGISSQYGVVGTSSIYSPTASGFRIYLQWRDGTPLTPGDARRLGWYVNWIGVDTP